MKVVKSRDQDELILRDNALIPWFISLMFMALGFCLVIISALVFDSTLVVLIGILVGSLNILGGIHRLWQEPISEVHIFRKAGKICIRRIGLSGVHKIELPIGEFVDADIEVVNNPTGELFYRPQVLCLTQGNQPLTMLWLGNRERCMAVAQIIKDFQRENT